MCVLLCSDRERLRKMISLVISTETLLFIYILTHPGPPARTRVRPVTVARAPTPHTISRGL